MCYQVLYYFAHLSHTFIKLTKCKMYKYKMCKICVIEHIFLGALRSTIEALKLLVGYSIKLRDNLQVQCHLKIKEICCIFKKI